MFPTDLTSVLTGASVWQFRDVVALRTVVRLRSEAASLRKVRHAFADKVVDFPHPRKRSSGEDALDFHVDVRSRAA